jgi:hypothetical protein
MKVKDWKTPKKDHAARLFHKGANLGTENQLRESSAGRRECDA